MSTDWVRELINLHRYISSRAASNRRRLFLLMQQFVSLRRERKRFLLRLFEAFDNRKPSVPTGRLANVRTHRVTLRTMTSEELRRRTRFTRQQFNDLLKLMKGPLERRQRYFDRRSLSPDQIVYVALRKLAHDYTYADIADEVGCSPSTAWIKTQEFALVARARLRAILVRPQSKSNVLATMKNWYTRFRLKFAYVHDGVHYDRKFLANRAKIHYWNRFGRCSTNNLIAQGSHNLIALVSSGYPGRAHDSNVMTRSAFYHLLHEGSLTGALRFDVGGQQVQAMSLGDSAYGLTKYIMAPQKGKHIPVPDIRLRTRFSRLRCADGEATHGGTRPLTATQAYKRLLSGILKQKFKYLLNKCRDDLPSQNSLSDCCIICHNWLVLNSASKSFTAFLNSCKDGIPGSDAPPTHLSPENIRRAFMRDLGLI